MSISDVIYKVLTNRDGAAGVEFALMLPALVLFVIGIVDVGALTYEQTEVSAAAHAGAQYAIRNGSGASLTNIASAVTGATPFTVLATPAPQQVKACVSGSSLVVTTGTTCAGGGTPGTYIQVNAQATYTPLISFGTLSMPTALSAQAMVRTQ
jgi:Flp pilus assembly protein TadG